MPSRQRQVRRVVRAAVRVAQAKAAVNSVRQCQSIDPTTRVRCELVDPHMVEDQQHRHRVPGSNAVVTW